MYCSVQEIRDEFAGLTISSAGTKVTETQVEAWINQESAQINAVISNRYQIPIVEGNSPISFLVLKRIALFRVSERVKNKIEIKTSVEQTSSEEKAFVQTRTPNSDLKDIASAIQLEINKRLPGIDAHKTMLPEGRTMPNNYLDNINNYKQSAVCLMSKPILMVS